MVIPEHEAKVLLSEYGIEIVPTEKVESITNLKASAEYFGFPVVLKFSSSRYSHKSDVGGVILGLNNYEELEKAYVKLDNLRKRLDPDAAIIMEPMIAEGIEFFVGVQRHRNFGLVMNFGLGGIFLELVKDVSFRLLPASVSDYDEMISELKCWPKLEKGFRNLPPADKEKLLRMLKQIDSFAVNEKGLKEMDLNPITFVDGRFQVVDARIVKDK